MSTLEKINAIEFLRGFAVSIVVLYHLYAVQVRYFGENIFPDWLRHGAWGVDIFFVISGVVMYGSVYGRPEPRGTWSFFRARIARIYPPYWVITSIIYVLAQFEPSLVNSSYTHEPSLVKSMLLFPDITTPWLNVGWSLIYEMWFYLILGMLLLVRKSLAVTLLSIYGLLLLLAGGTQGSGPVIKLITDPIILEFLLGFGLGAVYFQPSVQLTNRCLVVCISIPLAFFAATILGLIYIADSPLERFIYFGLPAVSLVALALYSRDFIAAHLIFKPFILIGMVSYSVYLTHVLLLNVFLYAVLLILELEVSPIMGNLGCFGFVIFSGAIYYYIVEKTTTSKFLRILSKFRLS